MYPKYWENSIKKIWPEFKSKFGFATDHLVLSDVTWAPISGGMIGENVITMFSQRRISIKDQRAIITNFGWTPQVATLYYTQENDESAKKPYENELLFSLGLGRIYDMIITKKLLGTYPRLEQSIINNYLSDFSLLKDLDQKFISPNTDNDRKYKISRLRVFSHGKAAYFLLNLRVKIGRDESDSAVVKYLKCQKCHDGYSDFKNILKTKIKRIESLEKKYKVL